MEGKKIHVRILYCRETIIVKHLGYKGRFKKIFIFLFYSISEEWSAPVISSSCCLTIAEVLDLKFCTKETKQLAAGSGYLQPSSPLQKLAVKLLSLPRVCTELLQEAPGFLFAKHVAQQVGFRLQQAEPLLQLHAVFQQLLQRKMEGGRWKTKQTFKWNGFVNLY